MRARRLSLFAGVTLFVVCATHRVNAGGPWEVEGGAYGGGGTGHMACGPDVRVAYGGLGGEVRYSGGREGDHLGVAFDVGGIVETQRQWPLDCLSSSCQQDFAGGIAPGGRARVGFDTPPFGLRIGLLIFTEPRHNQGLQVTPIPDGELRFGAIDGPRFLLGFGAYDLPTYLRPGAYCGLYVPTGRGWEIGAHAGLHYLTDSTGGPRETLTVRAPLTRNVWLRTDVGLIEAQGPGTDFVLSVGSGM